MGIVFCPPAIFCRFINAKPTLEASRQQALATDEWRRKRDVDNVFKRPAPMFGTIEKMLPFYSLGLTPEGHAVVYQKVRRSASSLVAG